MKISSLCTQCHNYCPVEPFPQFGYALAKCKCGRTTMQMICSVCNGTGWEGLTPCRCDMGLEWLRTYNDKTNTTPVEQLEFGNKIYPKRTRKSIA
jgi:hypothetical protein